MCIMYVLYGAPFLERWAMHVTGKSNQIGPSEIALGDDLHSTVGNSTKHLTSDACLHEWMRHGMERCGWCRPPSN